MNRIEATFEKLKSQNKKAFIPYIMAGDPSLGRTKELVLLLEECGADIIELGVPFTDPLADGPTIQRAAERALNNKVTLKKVIECVKNIRTKTNVPIILMTYYNPVFKYGEERFVKEAKESGVDGVIIPDLPPEEGNSIIKLSKEKDFAVVFLAAPTSTNARIKKVADSSSGFVYYVSMKGITGAKLLLDSSIENAILKIRKITKKPIAVGFGISTPEEAAAVSKFSDGIIVGSAIVKKIYEGLSDRALYELFLGFRKAI